MKIILTTLLAMSALAAVAGQAGAASKPAHEASLNVAAAEYDFPPFGSEQWWELQGDRGG